MAEESSIHFEISERKILLRIFDIFFVLISLQVVGIVFDFDYFQINEAHWFWSVILAFYLTFCATIFELYELNSASKVSNTIQGVVFTASLVSLAYLLTPVFTPPLPQNRLQLIYFFLAILLPLGTWRAIYIKFIASHRFKKNVLLIADAEPADRMASTLSLADHNFNVVGYLGRNHDDLNGTNDIKYLEVDEIDQIIAERKVAEIIIASRDGNNISSDLYNKLLKLIERGFPIRDYTQVYEDITNRVPVQHIKRDFYKYFPFSRSNHNRLYLFYARGADIIAAIIGLSFLGLCFPFIAFGNLIGNRGPLFYKQERVGRYGKPFMIYKLRSMVKDAERHGAKFAVAGDARITKFGTILRKSRLDEIPQFINVIRGEMSLIGPRPERPVFVKELAQKIPFYETRNVVKPGLTGWAQVKYPYGVTDEDHLMKLQYDLYYIKKRSIFLDLRVVIKTLSTVLFFKGQ
jgi:exopolysaccharide biosynthesis polyprenyl glycosylphosphotransferase